MEPVKFVVLYTDVVMWLIVLLLGVALRHALRSPSLRAKWRRVADNRTAVACAAVLLAFLVIALADSVHYRARIGATPQGEPVYATATSSLLDDLVGRHIAGRERSYSVPFAIRDFDKTPVIGEKGAVREFQRLKGVAAGLTDEEAAQKRHRDLSVGVCAAVAAAAAALALIALLCWSGSDLFSKIGCREPDDKLAHLKMVMAVGLVMGLHAAYEIFIGGTEISWHVIWTYLPVSLLYIGSMTLGYVGLRYIELSISSPICNASGALVALLWFITGDVETTPAAVAAVILVSLGVIGLGVVESREDEQLRAARQEISNYKYAKSWLALALPIAYMLLDAAGTFADTIVLRELNEDSANCAYELTFFAAAVVCFIYVVLIRRDRLVPKLEAPKYIGAVFETAGQFAYIYAIADEAHVMYAAPIISAYCAASVLWSRLFLREKLSAKHYLMILLVVIGIIILGILDL